MRSVSTMSARTCADKEVNRPVIIGDESFIRFAHEDRSVFLEAIEQLTKRARRSACPIWANAAPSPGEWDISTVRFC